MRTLAFVIALFTAWAAHAQSDDSALTFGNTTAGRCHDAANMATVTAGSLDNCNAALKSRTLSRKARIATLVNRGILLKHGGEYTAAIADFEAALALDPDTSAAYLNRGNVYFAIQQFDRAIEDYTTALQMNPREPHLAYYNRGLANEEKQDAKLAFADFVQATELRPEWEPAETRVQQYRAKGFE